MATIPEQLPDPDALLALEPEELAGPLLHYLASLPERDGCLHPAQFLPDRDREKYPPERLDEILRALTEAWVWLEREGLIAPRPDSRDGWIFVTRRGHKVSQPDDLKAFRLQNLLPREQLHPRIAQRVWATFLRGDYDSAVFQAFKEVEVAVRGSGPFNDTDLGVALMRKAFAVGNGPLTAPEAEGGEQQALSDLFSGAIGSYKNPHSHRNLAIDPGEAAEMIILASHLLSIVDRRAERAAGLPQDE